MNDGVRLYVLDEVWDEMGRHNGAIICPGCTDVVCSFGWEGELTAFETVCDNCDSDLLSFSAVFETNEYYQEQGSASENELREHVTEYWNRRLREGVSLELPVGLEHSGVIESGERAGEPYVEPVLEEVDQTEHFAGEYRRQAEQFGWGWEPPEGTGDVA